MCYLKTKTKSGFSVKISTGCQWQVPLPYIYLYLNHKHTHHITSDAAVIQFKWGSAKLILQVVIPPPNSMLIYLNTGSTFCLLQLSCLCQSNWRNVSLRKSNKLQRQYQVSEGKTEHFSPFICFLSPSIPLGITVIAASRYHIQLNSPFLDTSGTHFISWWRR